MCFSRHNAAAVLSLVADSGNGYRPRVEVECGLLLGSSGASGAVVGLLAVPSQPGNSRARNVISVSLPGGAVLAYVPTLGDRADGPGSPSPCHVPIAAADRLIFEFIRQDRRFDGALSAGAYDLLVYTTKTCGCGCKTKE